MTLPVLRQASEERPAPVAAPGHCGDREPVRRLLKQHHAASEFRDEPFSDAKFDVQADALLRRPARRIGLVAVQKGRITGLALAGADPYLLSDGPLFVSVQIITVDLEAPALTRAKTLLALVAAVKHWGKVIKASRMLVHVTNGTKTEVTGRLLLAAGAKAIGGNYVL